MGITAVLTAASLLAATAGGPLGVQVRVSDGWQQYVGRSGVAELGSTKPVPHNGQFRAGSVTKTFVSTVVLQLAGEGKVDLDAPVDRYLPRLLPHQEITVRNILQQTSGLFNYPRSFPVKPEELQQIRFKHWEPEELVAISTSRPLSFPPGTKWEYANTNYVVAGLLIEKLTGRPYAEAVEQRILKPLGLRDTYLPGDDPEIRRPHAHAYWMLGSKPDDLTRINPSMAWASGELISTTRDLDTFIVALARGKLLKPLQQEELTRTTSASPQYGLGLVVQKLPCGTTIWGHFGDIRGYETQVWTTPDTRKRLVVSITSSPSGGDTTKPVEKLRDDVFCGKQKGSWVDPAPLPALRGSAEAVPHRGNQLTVRGVS